jgi:hypothetical protein
MKLEQSQDTLLLNICELNSRIEAHEVQCEERTKTIFNRLEVIEKRLNDINGILTKIAFILVTSMGGILISLLLTRI